MSFLIVMVLLLVVMYVLMIRPQRQRQQAQQATIEKAGVGDDILTNGGIYGTITEADEDGLEDLDGSDRPDGSGEPDETEERFAGAGNPF